MSKKNKRKLLFCLIYLFVLGYSGFAIIQQHYRIADLNSANTELSKKIEAEYEKNEELKYEKENANTDEVIEKLAREKLGYIRSDEKIFVDSSNQQ